MRFTINNQTNDQPTNLLRPLGYFFFKENQGELNLIRPLSKNNFPRFHLFLKIKENNLLEANLHLDQKAPIYGKQKAHSGEYEENNPLLIEEANKIKRAFL
ncbi:hypothetical protein FJ208_02445 [Candidatus Gribaldobacteria bacterium]|nr:hypothetical protein [Candidatus Gribaldobacteria bacterium]